MWVKPDLDRILPELRRTPNRVLAKFLGSKG